MDNIILIFVCMLAGIALQRVKSLPANAYVSFNQFVIYISLPALALYYIPKIQVSTSLLFPLGIAWIGFLLSIVFFLTLAKIFRWPRRLTGCLILTAGLGNTSFVGFPVIEALYGPQGLTTAIIVDQPGTFTVMATLGIIVAAVYSKGSAGALAIARKIFLFPPFIAFFIAFVLNATGYDFVPDVQSVLHRLGNTVTPVALVAVGMQLKINMRNRHWNFLALGLFFKLMIMPAFFVLLYKIMLGGKGPEINVSLMEAAMAPMITASILASSHGLKPRLAGMMTGVGIPLSFVTLAFWYWLITYIII